MINIAINYLKSPTVNINYTSASLITLTFVTNTTLLLSLLRFGNFKLVLSVPSCIHLGPDILTISACLLSSYITIYALDYRYFVVKIQIV